MTNKVVLPNEGKSIRLGGVGIVFKLFSADTGGSFALVEHPLEPGTLGAPPHTHQYEDEYSYVLEGNVTVLVGENMIEAGPGTLIAKPRGVLHTFWNATSQPARILEIIAPAGMEQYFAELGELVAVNVPPNDPRRLGLAEKYHLEFDRGRMAELLSTYHLKM